MTWEKMMSPQLERVLDQARLLSPQEQLELIQQLSNGHGEVDRSIAWAEKIAKLEEDALASGQVERVEGGLVVKGQPGEVLNLDLVEFINQQREERIQQVMGW